MAKSKKRGLGKGLGALIGDIDDEGVSPPPSDSPAPAIEAQELPDGARLIYLDPTQIKPNPKQPRQYFDEEALQELADSVRQDGVQEPVIVRERGGAYELVSGERRVRAAVMTDLEQVPAICRDINDRDMLKLGLIENIQREDLNPIETARAYEGLISEFGWTQEQLADEVGKKRATVTNSLRLLNLPGEIQDRVADGSLSSGHAKALLGIENPDKQRVVARKIVREGLSVRQAEKMATQGKAPAPPKPTEKDPNVRRVEDQLRRALGTKVSVKSTSPDKGKIEIEYYGTEDLDRILDILRGR